MIRLRNSFGQLCGFTLIEILLVAALLALMAGIMAPQLSRSFQNVQLDGTMNELGELIETAGQYSIRQRTAVRLRVLEDSESCRVERRRSGETAGGYTRIEHGILLEDHRLPEGMRINIRLSEEFGNQQGEHVISFFPEGRRTPVIIELTDRRGRQRWLKLGPNMGNHEVLRINPYVPRQ